MPLYHGEPRLAMPARPHTQTAAAEDARRAHQHHAHVRASGGELVTNHGRPRWTPYNGEVVPSGARSLQRLAQEAGFETVLREGRDWCALEGIDRKARLGFRAYWRRGKTDGCSWHAPLRFSMVDDPRTVEVSAQYGNVAKAGHRAAGMDRRHLVQVSSPHGMPLNITALTAKLKELLVFEEA